MKNLIYSLILIASSSIYAQSGIESDAQFLKYEQAYLKMSSSNDGENYEIAAHDFYSKFTDYKERSKFSKSNDKEKWLNKNYKKTAFGSAAEAINSYTTMVNAQEAINKSSNDLQEIRNELLKKYDVNLIWDTLQNRIKAK